MPSESNFSKFVIRASSDAVPVRPRNEMLRKVGWLDLSMSLFLDNFFLKLHFEIADKSHDDNLLRLQIPSYPNFNYDDLTFFFAKSKTFSNI